jgi:hypothetical protein
VNHDIVNAETPMEGLTTVTQRQVIWIRFQPVGASSLRWSSSQIGIGDPGSKGFVHCRIAKRDFPMAPKFGPMVLAPGHQEGGLKEGRFRFSFGQRFRINSQKGGTVLCRLQLDVIWIPVPDGD